MYDYELINQGFDQVLLNDDMAFESIIHQMELNNKDRFAVAINLSPDPPGTHWTALYIDSSRKWVVYFDPFGETLEPLMNKLKKYFRPKGYKIYTNMVQYQPTDLRNPNSKKCGQYCCYFKYIMDLGLDLTETNIMMLKQYNISKFIRN